MAGRRAEKGDFLIPRWTVGQTNANQIKSSPIERCKINATLRLRRWQEDLGQKQRNDAAMDTHPSIVTHIVSHAFSTRVEITQVSRDARHQAGAGKPHTNNDAMLPSYSMTFNASVTEVLGSGLRQWQERVQ